MDDRLPRYVTRLGERRVEDALHFVEGVLCPEVREPLWPAKSFPVRADPGLGEVTAELEPVLGMDAAIEAQQLGLQYSVFVQHCRDLALQVDPPRTWDRRQLLWTDLPVFSEQPCEWHYPKLQQGFNVDAVEPPTVLRPDVDTPRPIGFLPNGDVVASWEIAEGLAERFDIEIEPVHSSVDGMALVVSRGVPEETLFESPIGKGVETGILLSKRETKHIERAATWIEAHGGLATPFHPSDFMFYRLGIPVLRAEMDMNVYLDFHIEPFDVSGERLTGYAFRVLDSPATRELPLFATERGNLVVSDRCFEYLAGALGRMLRRGSAGSQLPLGHVLPVIRTP